ncbi:hypothetical protein PV10_08226 [Exophiala mesophila]|uniref:AB hydrolase-1 domain-containing protein n=1 Tax=Exophiala mesophila TaxID=212818 RepID=A0A0D1ZP79_EXOME|nr:uncharacterized protein PV10_08226 [Exophiala mesophila]KIV88553.1 hypothetical protein PV10_08226 [Exophiala mesophila]
MRTSSAFAIGAALPWLFQTAISQTAQPDDHPILLLSEDESFHYELLLPFGNAIYGGADVNTLLSAAKRIKPGDFDSFSEVFYDLGNSTKLQAEDPENAYDPVNVRDTWFSAANYFRRADFYIHGDWENPLIDLLWKEQRSAFDKGLSSLTHPAHRVQIPAAENFWYAPSDEVIPRPTMVLCNGYDGAQEDMYHTIVVPALARGWNAITYEGPGQPTVRREQNIGFIHNWEAAVNPVVDYVLSEKRDVVDSDRLVLYGHSLGGYLAARAAAFEPRAAAVVLNGGIFNVFDSFAGQLPPDARALLDTGAQEAFDEGISALLTQPNLPSGLRWGIEHGLWAFNTRSGFEFFQKARAFDMEGVVNQIQMPVLTVDAEFEQFFAGQSELLAEALGEVATFHLFDGEAGYHCQAGALQELNRFVFAWLHKTLQ